ncbi:MAG: flagellar hook basal-body protein [Gemmatimonadota bacterium]
MGAGMSGDELIAAAKRVILRRQEAISNNLANASTAGFKGEHVFARVLAGATAGDGLVAESQTDLRPGALESTGRPLDLALEGPGFFVVETSAGDRLTRGGSFTLAADGTIIDAHGNALLGDGGRVRVPPGAPMGRVAVDGAGNVRVDGRLLGRLRVERTPDDAVLERQGSGLFVPPATRVPDRDAAGVRQGALEASNVNILDGLVELVLIQRAYGALHQVDAIAESVEGRAIELGKPAT